MMSTLGRIGFAVALSAALAGLQVHGALAQTPSPTLSTCYSPSANVFVCPHGDTPGLGAQGALIAVRVIDTNGVPIPNLAANKIQAFVLVNGQSVSCPQHPTYANMPTDATGATAIDAPLAALGSGPNAVIVQVAGMTISGSPLPIAVKSLDITGDGIINLSDVGRFAAAYGGGGYSAAVDFNSDGVLNLSDIGIFSAHLGHTCP